MLKRLPGWYWTLLLSLFSLGIGILAPTWLMTGTPEIQVEPEQEIAQASTATETLLPATPLSTSTPRSTLRPAPTFEPPTATAPPTDIPSATPTQVIAINATVEGIQGLPTETQPVADTCTVRDDWTLTVEVQVNETLTMIANRFDTTSFALADGNCLEDANVIVVGQQLLVPGDALPTMSEIVCEDFELLQPIDNAYGVPSTGTITFNWRGTRAPRYLLRLYPPDYDFDEPPNPDEWLDFTFDLRQNHTIDLVELEAGGRWYWQAIPLNSDFVQVCPASSIWSFNKNPLED